MARSAASMNVKLAYGMATAGAVLLAGQAAQAQGYTYVQPTGLTVGEHYRVVFLTADSTTSTSSDITTYNTFASNEASSIIGLTTTWSAIISTSSVDAINNIACTPSCASDPIYLVTGAEVASSTSVLFGGSILTPINVNQFGSTVAPSGNNYVFTGSDSTGAGAGGESAGGGYTATGDYTASDSTWIAVANNNGDYSNAQYPIYAISGDLVAGPATTPVPEPGSAPLMAAGVVLAAAAIGWRRHGNKSI